MGAYAGVTPNLLRSGAPAGSIIVWIGGPVTNGGGASTGSKRMSSIASRDLGLSEKNYASANATVSNGLVTRCYAARDDTSYDHAQVAYVVLAGGLQDPISALSSVIYKSRDAVNECKKAFPRARIIWAAGPGSLAGMTDTQLTDTTTIVSAILGQARAADALAVNLRTVLGTDTSMQSSSILPNDTGHEALAEAIVNAIRDDQGEPVDQPITPTRTYSSGLTDWASRQVEATRRREAEKREANRPTGTELGGVTEKLDQLTQAQGVQQVLLEQQQEQLQKQQEELERHQQELENQQKQLKAAQDQLAQQQNQLASQQNAIKAAQDQLAQQQNQLTSIVGQQGSTITSLQSITQQIQQQNTTISNVQASLGNFQKDLGVELDRMTERIIKLEQKVG